MAGYIQPNFTVDYATKMALMYYKADNTLLAKLDMATDEYAHTIKKVKTIITPLCKIPTERDYINIIKIEYGYAIEEACIDLITPLKYAERAQNDGKEHHPTFRLPFYTVPRDPDLQLYWKLTFGVFEFRHVAHNAAQALAYTAQKIASFDKSITLEKEKIKRQIEIDYIEELYNATDSTNTQIDTFDPTAEVKQIKNDADGNPRYHHVKNSSGQIATVMFDIPEDTTTSWADAVSKGLLMPLFMRSTIVKPGTGADRDELVDNAETFIIEFQKVLTKLSHLKEGYTLSGIINRLEHEKEYILLLRDGILPHINVDAKSGAFHDKYLKFPGFNIRVVEVEDFGPNIPDKMYAALIDPDAIKLVQYYDDSDIDKKVELRYHNVLRWEFYYPLFSPHRLAHLFFEPDED